MQLDDISLLIRRRRTIKPNQMDSRPIEKEVLLQLLENANWAPTHGMTEPWRFTIFQGNARKRLAEQLCGIYRQITPADEFKQNKYDSFAVNPTLAPVVLVVGMKRQAIEKISETDELAAVACAVQNLHLSATACGLGGFWSSNVAACSDAMRAFVGLEERDRVLGLFYLGYPKGDWPDSSRTPVAETVCWASES